MNASKFPKLTLVLFFTTAFSLNAKTIEAPSDKKLLNDVKLHTYSFVQSANNMNEEALNSQKCFVDAVAMTPGNGCFVSSGAYGLDLYSVSCVGESESTSIHYSSPDDCVKGLETMIANAP